MAALPPFWVPAIYQLVPVILKLNRNPEVSRLLIPSPGTPMGKGDWSSQRWRHIRGLLKKTIKQQKHSFLLTIFCTNLCTLFSHLIFLFSPFSFPLFPSFFLYSPNMFWTVVLWLQLFFPSPALKFGLNVTIRQNEKHQETHWEMGKLQAHKTQQNQILLGFYCSCNLQQGASENQSMRELSFPQGEQGLEVFCQVWNLGQSR